MPSPNINRLIGAFLAIAVIASSTAFGVSYIRRTPRSATSQQNGAAIPQNAFVETVPENSGGVAAVPAEANLTDGLAEQLAAQVIAKNPEGPVEQAGELAAVFPGGTDEFLKNYLAAHPVSENAILPDLSIKDITLAGENLDAEQNLAALQKYVDGLETLTIVRKDAPELNAASSAEIAGGATQTEEWLAATGEDLGTDVASLKSLAVPREDAELHIAMVELLTASDNFLNLVERDPIAGAALANKFEQYTEERSAKLIDEINKGLNVKEGAVAEYRKSIARLFGIPVANAQVPIWSAQALIQIQIQKMSFWQKVLHYAKYVWEIIKDVLTEYAKNRLLREMTRQTINWILGNGKPQFITNWQGFLNNAVDEAVGAVIAEAAPKLCGAGLQGYLGNFAALVKGLMKPVDIGTKRGYPRCTLTEVIQNVEDFKRDIRNGGWLSYSAVFEPQNTFMGQIFSLSERAAKRVAEEREAAVAKVESGFKPTEKCGQGGVQKGGSCVKATKAPPGGTCLKGEVLKDGHCLDKDGYIVGLPQTTTPANVASNLTVRSFDASYDLLVNSRDWKALAAFVLDAMITKLVVAGVNGLGGSANVQYIDSGGTEIPELSVAGQTDQVIQFKNQALGFARGADSAVSRTIAVLNQVVSSCSVASVVTTAKATKAALESIRNQTATDIVTLGDDIEALQQFKKDIKVHSPPYTISDLNKQFGKGGESAFETAKAERQKFAELRDKMNDASGDAADLQDKCSPAGG